MTEKQTKILAVFGSTGSIGQNTLEVVRGHPGHFSLRYLTGNSNAQLLCAQVREFRPLAVAVTDPDAFKIVRDEVGGMTEVLEGEAGLVDLAGRDDYDMLVSSLVGFAGLVPTITAMEAGHDIALANKETLVVAGELITDLRKRRKVNLLPVDSEHSAIMQCLTGEADRGVRRIILTASGGPFRGKTCEQLERVTLAQALRHPNWNMGSKITIDSSTLMNKGLEVIEAHWLFDVGADRIDVVVHPESIIHSMVEFTDGSVKAQLGVPDMKIPIHYALSWPDRLEADYERLDLARIGSLTFEAPDTETFRCLALAYDALREGGTAPAILNAANEIAVDAFLNERITYTGIPALIESCLEAIPAQSADQLAGVIDADRRTREFARKELEQRQSTLAISN